jgi:hypothetical protein
MEYDSYLIDVRNLLESGASSVEIRAYLEWVERDRITLFTPTEDNDAYIRAIRVACAKS